MAAPYLYPNFTNFTGWGIYLNLINDGWFWIIILVAFYAVVFLNLIFLGPSKAAGSAGMLTAIVAGFMFFMAFIGIYPLLIFLILAALGILALKYLDY